MCVCVCVGVLVHASVFVLLSDCFGLQIFKKCCGLAITGLPSCSCCLVNNFILLVYSLYVALGQISSLSLVYLHLSYSYLPLDSCYGWALSPQQTGDTPR